jgi:hypothetical protein
MDQPFVAVRIGELIGGINGDVKLAILEDSWEESSLRGVPASCDPIVRTHVCLEGWLHAETHDEQLRVTHEAHCDLILFATCQVRLRA